MALAQAAEQPGCTSGTLAITRDRDFHRCAHGLARQVCPRPGVVPMRSQLAATRERPVWVLRSTFAIEPMGEATEFLEHGLTRGCVGSLTSGGESLQELLTDPVATDA